MKFVLFNILTIIIFMSCNILPIRTESIELKNEYISELINNRCRQFNLDPVFVAGIIKAESNMRRAARSRSNALGYMQIKRDSAVDALVYSGYPELAKLVKNNQGYLYHSDINILAGCAYLRWILHKKKPTDWLSLMAYYNSGRPDVVVGTYIIKIKRFYEKYSKNNIDKSFKKMVNK